MNEKNALLHSFNLLDRHITQTQAKKKTVCDGPLIHKKLEINEELNHSEQQGSLR